MLLGVVAILAGIAAIAGTGFLAGQRVKDITGQSVPESVASRTFNDVQIIHLLMEHNAINWAQQACYHFLVNTSLGTYCDGSALKSNDGGVSATKLCNMAGYQQAEILGTRNWKSCYDNTVIAWNGSAWVTQNACDIGNVFVYPGVRCTKPLAQPPPSPAANPTPSDDAECQERFAIRVEASSPVVGPGEPPDSANSVLGAPDGGSADFDNEGSQPGYVTVSFSAPITDGSGDDIWLHHEDFSTTSQAGGAESEPFTLYGSVDGATFVALGNRQPTGPAVGASSVFGFDIARRLSNVRYVKVQNDTVVFEHPFEGPDIDAFEAAHLENCPAPTVPPGVISIPPGSVPPIPTPSGSSQCSDGIDNDSDNRIDAADPQCHTDFNANNSASYNPALDNEAEAFDPGGVREID